MMREFVVRPHMVEASGVGLAVVPQMPALRVRSDVSFVLMPRDPLNPLVVHLHVPFDPVPFRKVPFQPASQMPPLRPFDPSQTPPVTGQPHPIPICSFGNNVSITCGGMPSNMPDFTPPSYSPASVNPGARSADCCCVFRHQWAISSNVPTR